MISICYDTCTPCLFLFHGGFVMSGKILRVLNNNVILIKGKQGKQYILVGKGIGFNKHIGDRFVITKQVEQTFILQDNNNQKNYENQET